MLVKYLKKLCIIASIDIWKLLRYSIHFSLALEKNVQPGMFLSQSLNLFAMIRECININEFGCGIFIDLKKVFSYS